MQLHKCTRNTGATSVQGCNVLDRCSACKNATADGASTSTQHRVVTTTKQLDGSCLYGLSCSTCAPPTLSHMLPALLLDNRGQARVWLWAVCICRLTPLRCMRLMSRCSVGIQDVVMACEHTAGDIAGVRSAFQTGMQPASVQCAAALSNVEVKGDELATRLIMIPAAAGLAGCSTVQLAGAAPAAAAAQVAPATLSA
jgi:hypothetical protein